MLSLALLLVLVTPDASWTEALVSERDDTIHVTCTAEIRADGVVVNHKFS